MADRPLWHPSGLWKANDAADGGAWSALHSLRVGDDAAVLDGVDGNDVAVGGHDVDDVGADVCDLGGQGPPTN